MTTTQLLVLSTLLLSITTTTPQQTQTEHYARDLATSNPDALSFMETLLNFSIQWLSMIINFLKRVLVLTTLLFLIQNLINFWVLASSYSFLNIAFPPYFKNTISQIYTLYNQSIFSYIGADINYPHLTVSNQLYHGQTNSSNYQFDFFRFALEPVILITLTLVELTIAKIVIGTIKRKARQQREEYLNEAIQQQIIKKQPQQQQGKSQEEGKLSLLGHFFRNNKVTNQNSQENVQAEDLSTKNKNKNNLLLDFTYKIIAHQMKKELSVKSKHWTDGISINKMQKISALLINYIPALLLPAYSILFDNRLTNWSSKIGLMLYYCLLGAILLFPFVYLSYSRRKGKKGATIKSSDIQTLSQYALNVCMSLTLGIRFSAIPFLLSGFVILSILIVHSCMQGKSSISCGTLSCKKINNILHKLTFWLYHLVFIVLYMLTVMKQRSTHEFGTYLEGYIYWCGLVCLSLFVLGGCHQLLEFAINSLSFVFKIVHMLHEACTKEKYEKEETVEQNSQHPIKVKDRVEIEFQSEELAPSQSPNIFDRMRDEDENSEQNGVIELLTRQIMIHQVLLENVDECEL